MHESPQEFVKSMIVNKFKNSRKRTAAEALDYGPEMPIPRPKKKSADYPAFCPAAEPTNQVPESGKDLEDLRLWNKFIICK